MSIGRFDRRIPLPPDGDIKVMGPFDPEDDRINDADVLFLIVQGKGEDSAVVKGMGKWERDQNDNKWIADDVSRWGELPEGKGTRELRAGEIARGIALGIVVRPGTLSTDVLPSSDESQPSPTVIFDPPMVEGVTWCADFMFDPPAAS